MNKYFIQTSHDVQAKNKAQHHVKHVFYNIDRMIVDDEGRHDVIDRVIEHVRDTNRIHTKSRPLSVSIVELEREDDVILEVEGVIRCMIYRANEELR